MVISEELKLCQFNFKHQDGFTQAFLLVALHLRETSYITSYKIRKLYENIFCGFTHSQLFQNVTQQYKTAL